MAGWERNWLPVVHRPMFSTTPGKTTANRVGAWRLLDLFKALDLPCAVLANSEFTDYCPELIQAFLDRGDELVGHGRSNAESQEDLSEDDESALIAEATESLTQSFNDQPRGWLGPWIAQTPRTPDLLCEAGYRYLLYWCHDDQPVWMRTRNGEGILSVPYPQEINDIPAIAVRRAGAREFADMIVDQFDEMREQARSQPLALGIALHPYLVGQPFRLRPLRQALAHIVAHRNHIWLTQRRVRSQRVSRSRCHSISKRNNHLGITKVD